MTDLRHDTLFDRCVLVAEQRGERPNDFLADRAGRPSSAAAPGQPCPFCAGNEQQTPPASYERRDEQGAWRVRVVPNKYPAVLPEPAGHGAGVHEVVIETPRHVERVSELTPDEMADALQAYRDRLCHWRETGRYRYGLAFKNVGQVAGASLAHLHGQCVALTEVPPAIRREQQRLSDFRQQTGECGLCHRLAGEIAQAERVVQSDSDFLVFCPPASLHAYETWIVPRDHATALEQLAAATVHKLAATMHQVLCRLERQLAGEGYNVLFQVAPWDTASNDRHWRIEIRPRLTAIAGLELGSGMFINQVSPELAARRLRVG